MLEMGKFCPITPVDMTKVSCSNSEECLGKKASVSLTVIRVGSDVALASIKTNKNQDRRDDNEPTSPLLLFHTNCADRDQPDANDKRKENPKMRYRSRLFGALNPMSA